MFNDFMSHGKISNVIQILSDEHKGGLLASTDLTDGRPVLEILCDKHPEGLSLEPNCFKSKHPRTLLYHPLFSTKSVPGTSERMQ